MREIRAGDTIWIPPGEKHWHGAAPATAMVHLAMQEALDGKAVDWLEQVTQDQYTAEVVRCRAGADGRALDAGVHWIAHLDASAVNSNRDKQTLSECQQLRFFSAG